MPLAEQIKECIACERAFKQSDAILVGVTIEYSEQYCSKECEEQFEQFLQDESEVAKELELHKETITAADVTKIINNFHLKLTKDKPDA